MAATGLMVVREGNVGKIKKKGREGRTDAVKNGIRLHVPREARGGREI
jgi:hypothetical protein